MMIAVGSSPKASIGSIVLQLAAMPAGSMTTSARLATFTSASSKPRRVAA